MLVDNVQPLYKIFRLVDIIGIEVKRVIQNGTL